MKLHLCLVILAKAGIQYKIDMIHLVWPPACAGVTSYIINFYGMKLQRFILVKTGGTTAGPPDAGSGSGMTKGRPG